jgi:hypothetical protein
MKKIMTAVMFSVVACAGCSQPRAADSEPSSASLGTSVRMTNTAPATLCRSNEVALFSCSIKESAKLASLCVSTDLSAKRGYAYYAFGTHKKVELRYPERPASPLKVFQRTHLVYAGPTGAFAYSFLRSDVQYVLYSISGPENFESQGVLAYRVGASAPLANLKCKPGSVVETEDPALTDFILTWPENAELAEHGLPF